ncbi:hypothetical protein ASF33_21710 [Methylobacterium sp. Leaf92]|nr:hypothetical protein ASF33_21710 [Methylobacterium sp. Leaf92]
MIQVRTLSYSGELYPQLIRQRLAADTDQAGAQRVSGAVQAAGALLGSLSAGLDAGAVTVSSGVAAGVRTGGGPLILYRLAGTALHGAEACWRNQTRYAYRPRAKEGSTSATFRSEPVLRLGHPTITPSLPTRL